MVRVLIPELLCLIPVFTGRDFARPAYFFAVVPGNSPGQWQSCKVESVLTAVRTDVRRFGLPLAAVADAMTRAAEANGSWMK